MRRLNVCRVPAAQIPVAARRQWIGRPEPQRVEIEGDGTCRLLKPEVKRHTVVNGSTVGHLEMRVQLGPLDRTGRPSGQTGLGPGLRTGALFLEIEEHPHALPIPGERRLHPALEANARLDPSSRKGRDVHCRLGDR